MDHPGKILAALGLALAASTAWAQHSGAHDYVAAAGLQWAPVPSLPKGAQAAVLEGPMSQAVPFTVRLRFPAGYRIPPHTHPAVERVTVLSGTLHMGMGDKFDPNAMKAVRAGDLMIMQPGTAHFASAEGETVVQLHGTGPWGISYIDPADDPRHAARPLYDRLGGAAGISAIVEDVIAAHLANPVVGARFRKVSDIERTKRMASDFFSAGAGGPQKYAGMDMRTAHRGMDVSEQEFAAVVDDIAAVLDRRGIDRVTRKDVLSILDGLKGEIVGK
jgi:quercetin dioxygenase-like cupin family protein/truncated hemoglobin YjbI